MDRKCQLHCRMLQRMHRLVKAHRLMAFSGDEIYPLHMRMPY